MFGLRAADLMGRMDTSQIEVGWPRMVASNDSRAPSAAAADKLSSADAYVRFENIQKSYDGETLVVKDLNLSIRRGEFLTMLGPSGSGKTTTLMMLAGFETPTHGEI